MNEEREFISIVDYGSQYTQLIARRSQKSTNMKQCVKISRISKRSCAKTERNANPRSGLNQTSN